MLRPGPIVTASGALCIIDEVAYVPDEDKGYLLNAMQEGFIPFNKSIFHQNFSASFIFTSNTTNKNGRWNNPDKIDMKELPISGAMLDRIDYILAFKFQTFGTLTKGTVYRPEKS